MARAGETLENPITGERIVWRQVARDTGGQLLELDIYMAPGGFVAAEHVHPIQEERFEVVAGTIKMRLNGSETTMRRETRPLCPPGHRTFGGVRARMKRTCGAGSRRR